MLISLKAAREILESRGYKISKQVMKKAAMKKQLKAQLFEDAPKPYYVTTIEDATAWADEHVRVTPRKESEGEK
jgi:hypothetical protein